MKLTIFTPDATQSREADFNLPMFEGSKGLQAVKEVVVAHKANARLGTHSTKTRGEVRGGGEKPWAQKGTGRARAGMTSSPIWRGGGKSFAAGVLNFKKKINKKMFRGAMLSALASLIKEDRLIVVDTFDLGKISTKDANLNLKSLKHYGIRTR